MAITEQKKREYRAVNAVIRDIIHTEERLRNTVLSEMEALQKRVNISILR